MKQTFRSISLFLYPVNLKAGFWKRRQKFRWNFNTRLDLKLMFSPGISKSMKNFSKFPNTLIYPGSNNEFWSLFYPFFNLSGRVCMFIHGGLYRETSMAHLLILRIQFIIHYRTLWTFFFKFSKNEIILVEWILDLIMIVFEEVNFSYLYYENFS